MGKKTKIGKQRRDVFYNLAKETGYRSRAAFKLIQLNRKFEFLEKTRVCVDLCAAPGGWLQVAQQHMPVSSLIIGMDLAPIKAIHNVQTFKCDITTEECRSILKKELKTWKVDTFLHDGAPNVGKSWDYDAYMQNCLTLSALKLATEFLMKGGYFVTKIFRSKDYNALIWVLNKLFTKVHATKPKASRQESAEIFVVCEGFKAPDFIDPKFFQANYLFKEILDKDELRKAKKDFLKPVQVQKKAKASGYDDNAGILHTKLDASTFIAAKNHVELLSRANEIVFDNKMYEQDPLTKENIKDYCKDIKLLNRKELLELIKWQRKMRSKYVQDEDEDAETAVNKVEEITEPETEESVVDKMLKKQKKRVLKERRKAVERLNMKMVHKDDQLHAEDDGLFSLNLLKDDEDFETFNNCEPDDEELIPDEEEDEEDDAQNEMDPSILRKLKERSNVVYVDRTNPEHLKEFDTECPDSDLEMEEDDFGKKMNNKEKKSSKKAEGIFARMSAVNAKMQKISNARLGLENFTEEQEPESDNLQMSASEEEDNEPMNEVFTAFGKDSKLNKAKMFFQQGLLKKANLDDDIEIDLMEKNKTKEPSKPLIANKPLDEATPRIYESDGDDDSSESDEEEQNLKKNVKLDAKGLALGTLLVKSAKNKRDIMNEGWNRYNRGDEDVPAWFKADEDKHFKKQVQVPNNLVSEYNGKLADINIKTCKKVAEAKARKKRRALKVMEKLKKKTENITENNDMTEREKMANIKKIYKKAMKSQEKQKTTVIVAKKGRNNMRKPRGVKGKYKVVDPRMKKDKRAEKKRVGKGKARAPAKRLPRKRQLAKESAE